MDEDIFAYFDSVVIGGDCDWLQSAVECANAMYHLNGHLYYKIRTAKDRELTRINQAKYRKRHPDKVRLRGLKREDRKRNYPHKFTDKDWKHAVTYFNGCCAVCGRQLKDLFGTHTAAMDHWIPISSPNCPGTVPTNIVPLCHGEMGCNNLKSGKDAETWVLETYGKIKGKKILKRINDYFASLQPIGKAA
jgi:5-methylcytosine-specific restriction endonuclease McrA